MKKIFILTALTLLALLAVLKFDSNDGSRAWDTPIERSTTNFERKHIKGPQDRAELRKLLTYRENQINYLPGYQQKELKRAFANTSLSKSRRASAEMISRGPFNVPGRARGLIVLPQDNTHLTWLVGSSGGGIWKTTDGGTSWVDKSVDFPSLAVTSLAYCESNPNVIYAGTGEYVASAFTAINGDGLFKSVDAGETWLHLPTTAGNNSFQSVTRVIVDPSNENVVLASTAPNYWGDFNSQIMKSIDGGLTWNSVFSASAGAIEQIVASPDNFNRMYACQRSVGVLLSEDGGSTWSVTDGMSPDGRIEIAISPVDPQRIYASATGGLDNSQEADIYYSDDSGLNWQLITHASAAFDVLGGQGWYDNTVLAHPYNLDEFYIGGVALYKYKLEEGTFITDPGFLGALEENTDSFMGLVTYDNGVYYGNTIGAGTASKFTAIEIRFGSGKKQMAHRYTVPEGQGPGVATNDYAYRDYVEVPFEVWDVGVNPERQLMVGFRDQQRDGKFNLIAQNTAEGDEANHSREYLYINNLDYSSTTPIAGMAANGGQEFQNMYFLWPFLAEGATWNDANIPDGRFVIKWGSVTSGRFDHEVVSYAYGSANTNLHPDHHNLVAVIHDDANKKWQMVNVNDGGAYSSDISTEPGLTEGAWRFAGAGMNTTQFYGADKAPGEDRFVGGAQDNGSFVSPKDEEASVSTSYEEVWGGDGFDAVWHATNPNLIVVTSQNLNVGRSRDGGATFTSSTGGLDTDSSPPFIGQFEYSPTMPDVLYTVGADGVYQSTNFGSSWKLNDLTSQSGWRSGSLINIEISDASPDIVWAGGGVSTIRDVFLSTDQGTTFTSIPKLSFADGWLSGIASDPHDHKVAYLLFSYANSPKILKTADLGQTWTDISGFSQNSTSTGFPDVAIYDLQVMPHDKNILWVGTEIGIVESLDGGSNWHLLESQMPQVSVWKLRVKDDQIVVATHGRGIWTYQLPQSPEITYLPTVVSLSPGKVSGLSVKVDLKNDFDSLVFYINNSVTATFKNLNAGVDSYQVAYNLASSRVNDESFSLIAKAYKESSPFTSSVFSGEFLEYTAAKDEYVSSFESSLDASDFKGTVFSIKTVSGFDSKGIHSPHVYLPGSDYVYNLKVPITIKSGESLFRYRDIAFMEPGESGSVYGEDAFNDYVVVEGSLDGFSWKALGTGYDASSNAGWLSKFTAKTNPGSGDFVSQTINLLDYFSPGEEVIFRFRLHANSNTIVGWGWAIDDLNIQGAVLGLDDLKAGVFVYPNPVADILNIRGTNQAIAGAEILTLSGKSVRTFTTISDGKINISDFKSGIYLLRVIYQDNSSSSIRIVKK